MDDFAHYCTDVKYEELFNRLTTFKYKTVRVFGHNLKVPVKIGDEFENHITSMETFIKLLHAESTVLSNQSVVRVRYSHSIPKEKGVSICKYYYFDFELWFPPFAVVNLKLRRTAVIRRITIRDSIANEVIFQTSKNFHLIAKKMVELL